MEKIEFHLDLAKKHRKNNPKKRIWHARKALSLAEKYKEKKARGRALGEIGSYFKDQAMHDSAEYYYNKTLLQFKQINDRTNCATTLLRISNLAEKKGDLIKSFQLLTEADSLFKLENKTKYRVSSNVAIANLLVRQKDYDKAILYLKRAEENTQDDLSKKGVIYNNMIGCYSQLEDYDNSYAYAKKAIEIKKSLNDQHGLYDAYNNLAAIIYAEKGPNAEVIRLLTSALEGYKLIDDKLGVIRSYNSLGSSYRRKKEYNLAKQYLKLSEKLCEEVDNYNLILSNKKELHKLFAETNDWQQAYSYYSDFKEMEDSINSLEKAKIIQDLQTKYDTKEFKRESELAKVNEQLSEAKALKSRNTSILIFALGLLSILILLFVYFQFRQRKKKEVLELKLRETKKRLKFEQQSRLSELKALQSQMNPHFIFNSLNSIQDLILQNDRRNSISSLGKFSELTRKILDQSNYESISVAKEIELINLYVDLEKLRFGDDLDFKVINLIDEKESEELLLPSMFIQPYIENAFKHGLIHKKNEKTLTVTFQKENNQLICTIEDNGVGRAKANEINLRRKKSHLGFSTEANTKRIDLLNYYEDNNIRLEVIDKMENDKPSGTIVKIYVDISANEQN